MTDTTDTDTTRAATLPALYHYHTELLRNVARAQLSGYAAAVAGHLETHATRADVERHAAELAAHGYLTLHTEHGNRDIEHVALITSKTAETWPQLLAATRCKGSASGHHTYRHGACDNCNRTRRSVESDAVIELADAVAAADRIRERMGK